VDDKVRPPRSRDESGAFSEGLLRLSEDDHAATLVVTAVRRDMPRSAPSLWSEHIPTRSLIIYLSQSCSQHQTGGCSWNTTLSERVGRFR